MKVKLTCALPLYRSKDIAWLAFESLCRQEGIDFEWELIVIEEAEPLAFGVDRVRAYEKRLSKVGCRLPVTYIGLSEWVPLSQKWHRAAQLANSDGFLLVAGDDYAQPQRLTETAKLFDEGAEWVHAPLGYFYDINQGILCVYDHSLYEHPCALDKAVRTKIIRNALPEKSERKIGVDGWVYSCTRAFLGREPVVVSNNSSSWKHGVFTDGMNTLSLGRRSWYSKSEPKCPFRLPEKSEPAYIRDIVPREIEAKLAGLMSKK